MAPAPCPCFVEGFQSCPEQSSYFNNLTMILWKSGLFSVIIIPKRLITIVTQWAEMRYAQKHFNDRFSCSRSRPHSSHCGGELFAGDRLSTPQAAPEKPAIERGACRLNGTNHGSPDSGNHCYPPIFPRGGLVPMICMICAIYLQWMGINCEMTVKDVKWRIEFAFIVDCEAMSDGFHGGVRYWVLFQPWLLLRIPFSSNLLSWRKRKHTSFKYTPNKTTRGRPTERNRKRTSLHLISIVYWDNKNLNLK